MNKGDICIIKLVAGAGHEQYGERPAILISDTKTGLVVVIPLTGNLNALKFPYVLTIFPDNQNKLNQKSIVLLFQIRAIDQSRIVKIVGRINKNTQKKIDNILKEMMNL